MIKSSESEYFTGSLYLSSGHENYVVKIYLGFDDIRFVTENGEEYSAFYEKAKFGLGGFENRQLQIDAVCTDDKEVTCFVVLEEKGKFLKKCETFGHGIDRKQIANISRSDKNNNRLFGLYIFLAFFSVIIGVSLFYIYSKPFAKFIVSYLPAEQESAIGKLSAQNILSEKKY